MSYLPNIRCPHCKKPCVVSIDGYGGELATRQKECSTCGATFHVHVLTRTTVEDVVSDGMISNMKGRITRLTRDRTKTMTELLLKYEALKPIFDKALQKARAMRVKSRFN